jgi:hypothetical protein
VSTPWKKNAPGCSSCNCGCDHTVCVVVTLRCYGTKAGTSVTISRGSTVVATHVTDAAGSFCFATPAPGVYTITASRVGFTSKAITVTIVCQDYIFPITLLTAAPCCSGQFCISALSTCAIDFSQNPSTVLGATITLTNIANGIVLGSDTTRLGHQVCFYYYEPGLYNINITLGSKSFNQTVTGDCRGMSYVTIDFSGVIDIVVGSPCAPGVAIPGCTVDLYKNGTLYESQAHAGNVDGIGNVFSGLTGWDLNNRWTVVVTADRYETVTTFLNVSQCFFGIYLPPAAGYYCGCNCVTPIGENLTALIDGDSVSLSYSHASGFWYGCLTKTVSGISTSLAPYPYDPVIIGLCAKVEDVSRNFGVAYNGCRVSVGWAAAVNDELNVCNLLPTDSWRAGNIFLYCAGTLNTQPLTYYNIPVYDDRPACRGGGVDYPPGLDIPHLCDGSPGPLPSLGGGIGGQIGQLGIGTSPVLAFHVTGSFDPLFVYVGTASFPVGYFSSFEVTE